MSTVYSLICRGLLWHHLLACKNLAQEVNSFYSKQEVSTIYKEWEVGVSSFVIIRTHMFQLLEKMMMAKVSTNINAWHLREYLPWEYTKFHSSFISKLRKWQYQPPSGGVLDGGAFKDLTLKPRHERNSHALNKKLEKKSPTVFVLQFSSILTTFHLLNSSLITGYLFHIARSRQFICIVSNMSLQWGTNGCFAIH